MMKLLEKALEQVLEPPQDEQDAIASQILAELEDDAAWTKQFRSSKDKLRRMPGKAAEEDERGETHPLDKLL